MCTTRYFTRKIIKFFGDLGIVNIQLPNSLSIRLEKPFLASVALQQKG